MGETRSRPCVLPPQFPARLYGRSEEIERLDAVRGGGRPGLPRSGVAVLLGLQGTGKTALAGHYASSVGRHFADGVLYYDLGASTVEPIDLQIVLRQFLVLLGVPAADIVGTTVAELAVQFRSVTADRKLLIVLDDVDARHQVAQLRPTSPESMLVVTCRARFDGPDWLDDGATIDVGPLPPDVAREYLYDRLAPQLVAAEPAAIETLLRHCAGLPLALSLVAGRLGGWSTARAGRLARQARGLADGLSGSTDGPVVERLAQVLGVCLDRLPADLQAALSLAMHPGDEFGVPAAAAILDRTEVATLELLDRLCEEQLITERQPPDDQRRAAEPHEEAPRFRFHGLVRQLIRRRVLAQDGAAAEAAVRRLVRWYLRYAVSLAKSTSGRPWEDPAFAGIAPAYPPDRRDAADRAWEAEQHTWRAVVREAYDAGLGTECAQLADALTTWYYDTDRVADLLAVTEQGLIAAAQVGADLSIRLLHRARGRAAEKIGDFPTALHHFTEARRLATGPLAVSSQEEWLGITYEGMGDLPAADHHLGESRQVLEGWQPADPGEAATRGRALAMNLQHQARIDVRRGRPDTGWHRAEQAHQRFSALRDAVNAALATETMGRARLLAGAPDEARELLAAAVDAFAAAGALPGHQLDLLDSLAELSGPAEAARYRELGDQLRRRLGKQSPPAR